MEFKKNNLEHESVRIQVTKAKNLDHGQFEAVLSTDDLDRHGERVSIKGLVIPKGQVIKMYYNHETNGTSLPIGKWLKVWKSGNKLMGLGEVDLEDEFAVKVYKKVLKGYIDSISVGFYPQEFDGESSTWTRSELVEASVVAEPANVNALITSKDLGFTDDEFKESLKVRLKQENVVDAEAEAKAEAEKVLVQRLVKGAVADVLTEPKKWELMKPYYEVTYAFEEAYYNENIEATEFNTLLTETIGLLQSIVDGSYDLTDKSSESSDADPEIKTAFELLKSKYGTLEAAVKATNDEPATKKLLIKVRTAAKEVDKSAEELNKTLRIKLKET
jgi:HK97 family phage prohead protease